MIGSSVFAKLAILNNTLNLGLANPDSTVRIFPNYVRMADKDFPQLVFACDDYESDTALDGPTGTASVQVKIVAAGQTYDSADALGRAVATALDGTKGQWGSTTVQGCFLDEVSEDHITDTDMETILYFVKELTFKVIFNT